MESKEILKELKDGANFEMEQGLFGYHGWGSITHFKNVGQMTPSEYEAHYNKKKAILESLPWNKVVEDPRNPKPEEYPNEDGEFITMLDCNEHEVMVNRFSNGGFLMYNRTHVKWWMPVPTEC